MKKQFLRLLLHIVICIGLLAFLVAVIGLLMQGGI
jgi:hypothetical protein